MAIVVEAVVDQFGQLAVLFRMGAVVVVHTNQKVFEVSLVNGAHIGNMLLGANAFFICFKHDGSSMGIVCRNIVTFVPAHSLKAHPDVGLGVLQNMAKMQCSVGIGQGVGDQYLAL